MIEHLKSVVLIVVTFHGSNASALSLDFTFFQNKEIFN